MRLTVCYFAALRERIGCGEEVVHIDAAMVTTIADLADWLIAHHQHHARYAAAFRDRTAIHIAHNHQLAQWHTHIADGDEVAFFPPVTGG